MISLLMAAESPSATITAAVIALAATIIAGVIAVGWPSWSSRQTGRRFVSLIRRELEEIGPNIGSDEREAILSGDKAALPERSVGASDAAERPWWEYLSKRFVHEEFLSRDRISDHRDFVLSLDPSLVYLLSQLWISFEKHDGAQWVYYMGELAKSRKVKTDDLEQAAVLWRQIVETSPTSTAESVRGPAGELGHAVVERIDGLFAARLHAYQELTQMLTSASMADEAKRRLLVDPAAGPLTSWYRTNGLLLSGNSLDRFLRLRDLLAGEPQGDRPQDLLAALQLARSVLRTELKIDLGIRHPDERDEPTGRVRRRESRIN